MVTDAYLTTNVSGLPSSSQANSQLHPITCFCSSALSAALILMLPETAASKAAADKGAEYGTFAKARRDEPGGKAT